MINYVELFEKMSNDHLRMCNNGREELLIRNKQSNGMNYSLYLEALKINLNNAGIIKRNGEFDEFGEFGAYGDRYIVIKDYEIRFKNKKFVIKKDNNFVWESEEDNVIDKTVEFINQEILS